MEGDIPSPSFVHTLPSMDTPLGRSRSRYKQQANEVEKVTIQTTPGCNRLRLKFVFGLVFVFVAILFIATTFFSGIIFSNCSYHLNANAISCSLVYESTGKHTKTRQCYDSKPYSKDTYSGAPHFSKVKVFRMVCGSIAAYTSFLSRRRGWKRQSMTVPILIKLDYVFYWGFFGFNSCNNGMCM